VQNLWNTRISWGVFLGAKVKKNASNAVQFSAIYVEGT
jgi:hypothetical protein